MRRLIFLLIPILIPLSILAEEKPRVTVVMKDGRTVDFKLDIILDKQIIGLERFTLDKVTLPRGEVVSISFNRDRSDKFRPGQEGVVLTDGTVILGRLTSMDMENFYVRPPGKNKDQAVLRSKTEFIQFPKPEKVDQKPIPPSKTVQVSVPVTMQWVDTSLNVSEGEKMWFTVSPQQQIRCSETAVNTNADGVHPFWHDDRRPMPTMKACALIGRIGTGKPFFIGLQQTPVTAESGGRLHLGTNDSDFRDNEGEWMVFIRTEK